MMKPYRSSIFQISSHLHILLHHRSGDNSRWTAFSDRLTGRHRRSYSAARRGCIALCGRARSQPVTLYDVFSADYGRLSQVGFCHERPVISRLRRSPRNPHEVPDGIQKNRVRKPSPSETNELRSEATKRKSKTERSDQNNNPPEHRRLPQEEGRQPSRVVEFGGFERMRKFR